MTAFLRRSAGRVGMAALAVGLIFGLWNLVIFAFHLKPYALPTPQSSVATIVHRWSIYQGLTVQTVEETAYGFLIGAGVGFLLGVVMSASKLVQRLIYPTLITSQAVPIVAIAAPLAILFGFGLVPKLVIVAWIVFFPVVVNVLDGHAHVDPDLVNLARVMGAKRTRAFLSIHLPATLSPLFSGLKIGAAYAVTGAVIGEWVASAQQGLGTYLQTANASLDTQGVFGATILLTLIGVASFLLMVAGEVIATPWRTRSTARRGLRSLFRPGVGQSAPDTPERKGARRWFGSLPGVAPRGSRSHSRPR
ncbi:MAG TPA: ABC transporter permease [Gaiellaceae bacterium]|nr:ABC transporter permease [Gaiellaceae bacterium]